MQQPSFISKQPGQVIWLTGVSGAGKTTLGKRLAAEFKSRNLPVEFLDGNGVRDFFEGDLGYSRSERIQNVRRIAFAAKLLADHGVHVVVANIAPYYEVRDFIRRKIPRYIQIFLDVPMDVVKQRDAQGLYRSFEKGKTNLLIGLDDVYDRPRNPDLTLKTADMDINSCMREIGRLMTQRGIW